MNTKTLVDSLISSIRSVQAINTTVGIIFFFVWSEIMPEIIGLLNEDVWIIIGILPPILLLIGVLQYKNRLAYASVLSIFSLCILINLSALPYYVDLLIAELNGNFKNSYICPKCEIEDSLFFSSISFMAISLMHNRIMTQKYKWSAMHFYRVIIGTILLYSFAKLFFWIAFRIL